jgi:hypothetical protein
MRELDQGHTLIGLLPIFSSESNRAFLLWIFSIYTINLLELIVSLTNYIIIVLIVQVWSLNVSSRYECIPRLKIGDVSRMLGYYSITTESYKSWGCGPNWSFWNSTVCAPIALCVCMWSSRGVQGFMHLWYK